MQAQSELSVPGTCHTVNREDMRRAVGRLATCGRSEALDYFAGGAAPSEKIAEALRQPIVELADERRERDIPEGTSSSHR
jgi:hypothetical protein